MSGDVQPRKRKDKKRRKDEDEGLSSQSHKPFSAPPNDDINIHVHKEGGTGGGICAKIVFFILFSALIVLIGLIIKENQGLTDLDTVEESRFSQIFEGWVDKSPDVHDDHHDEDAIVDDDEDHNEYEDHSEDDEDYGDKHETEEESEEAEENEEEEEENEETVKGDEDDEEEVDESEAQASEEDEGNEEDDIDEAAEASEEEQQSEEAQNEEDEDDNAEDESKSNEEENDKQEDELGDEGELVSVERTSKEKDDDNNEKMESAAIKNDQDQNDEESPQKESSHDVNVGPDGREESDSDNQSDDGAGYEFSNITNKEDQKIKEKIDEGEKQLKNNVAFANKIFDALLEKYPTSPRSLYGKATALDILADERKSNQLLQQATEYYLELLNAKNVPNALFVKAAERCIDRMRFMGHYKKAILVHKQLIERFPNKAKYFNDLAVTYLTINLVEEARSVLKSVISKWPNDGFALVHYGFILKTTDNNLKNAVNYMTKGMRTKAPGVVDGRFYFHLGDALARLGKTNEAMKVYEEGVKEKVFLSKYQRSLYNVPRLTPKPWWEKHEIHYNDLIRSLEENWQQIRDEGLAVLDHKGYFQDESENLKDTGNWKQFELFARGQKNSPNCRKCPFTCNIIHKIADASGCKRGQTKFSVMHPGTHVWPHCGPTNCRLRVHLGLKVPPKTFIRVAMETRSWKEGEVIVFDDSFEHEVWHNGTELRLVLIVDVWHPELTSSEKRSLSPI